MLPNILGIVTKTHDTGVAILSGGQIVAAIEEERLNRIKHTQLFPRQALDTALTQAGLALQDFDFVTTPWDVAQLRASFRRAVLGDAPHSLNLLRPASHSTQNSGIVFLNQRLKQGLRQGFGKGPQPPIVEVAHHDAHAALFFVSPFDEAAVLVMDGYGDDAATSMYHGRDNQLDRLWHSGFFDSIGALYTSMTMYLGFQPFEEGTVMALAACGGDTYKQRFRKLVTLEPDGQFRFNRDYISFQTYGLIQPFTPRFTNEFGPPRSPGAPLDDRHRDLAAALQATTEDMVLHLARAIREKTSSRNLCISGGVALNCVANARILEDTDFERVWVPPCASDTGAPLGSALWQYHQKLDGPRTTVLRHAFYGPSYTDQEIQEALSSFGLSAKRLEDPELFDRTAAELATHKIVGWFQGRFEIGPRALGNRSILADPRDVSIKAILNDKIKHREPFRPFAPAVLSERAKEYFEIDQPDPFMTMAPRVRQHQREKIAAAVHVDGTARIQTVDREDNPRFHRLIETFGERTGVPVLLNTSFNRQEPIVGSPADAISCYLRTNMDVLILNNFYVDERPAAAIARARDRFAQQQRAIASRLRKWRQIFET